MADEKILRVGVVTDQAEQNLDRLEKKFVSTGKGAQGLEDANKRLGDQARRLSSNQQDLGSKTSRLRTAFGELAQGLRQTVGLMTSLGGSISFGLAIRSSLQLDAAMDKVKSITNATNAEMKSFNVELRKLSVTVGKPQTELAESLFLIKQAGFEGADAMRVLNASSRAAATGLGDTKTIADAVTSVLNLYGKETITANRATGLLILTAREGKVSMDQFEAGLGKVLPVAKSLGISFDEVAAALATMSRSGVDTKQAAASLAVIMDTLAAPSTDAAKALGEAGITIDKLRASLADKGIIAVLGDLKKAFEGNEAGLNRLFPSLRGMTGVLTLVGDKAADATRIQKLLADEAGGALTKAFEDVKDESLKYDIALQKINNQMIDLGTENLPVVSALLASLNTVMDGLRLTAKNTGEAMARAFTGPADPLQALRDYIASTAEELDTLESRRNAILRNNTGFTGSTRTKELDSDSKKSGFGSFADLTSAVNQGRALLAGARKQEARDTEAELVSLADRLGSKTIDAYRASIIRALNTHKLTFGLSSLFTGYTQAEMNQFEIDLSTINRSEADLEVKRAERNKARGLAIPNNAPSAGRSGGGLGSPSTPGIFVPTPEPKPKGFGGKLADEERAKILQLTDQYDEFNNKVSELTKNYGLLVSGVKAGAISNASAANAYGNMVADIAKTSAASGNFQQAIAQSKVAVKLLDDALVNHGTSIDTVRLAYKEMFGGLVQLAGEQETFAGKLSASDNVVTSLAQAVGKNGISVEAAKGNVKSLVEQLAGASTATGVFATSVKNANDVLDFMAGLVKEGALDIEVAKRVYNELGKTLNQLHPNLDKNKQTQEAWNTLVSSGLSPLDTYQERLRSLADAYKQLVLDGGDAEKAQRLFANSAAVAANDYRTAIEKLTPQQQKQADAIDRVAQASANAFSTMIQGAGSAKAALNGLLRSILDVITQLLILEPIKQAITAGLSGFIGAPAPAQEGANIAVPGRLASGGIAIQGRHYEVGEEGPELLVGAFEGARAILVGQKGPEHIIGPKGGGCVISNRETKELLKAMPDKERRALVNDPVQLRIKKSITEAAPAKVKPKDSVEKKAFAALKVSENIAEKRAAGGIVNGGSSYLVGEEGPELMLTGQSRINKPQRQTFQPIVVKVDVGNRQDNSPKTVVNIQNNTGQEATQTTRKGENGIDIVSIVIGAVTRNIDERGSVSKAISRNNRLTRR